jgi:PRTRC genetic system protein B
MKLIDKMVPSAIMVFYSTSPESSSSNYRRTDNNDENTYIEYMPVHNGKPGAGIPLSDNIAFKFANMMLISAKHEIGGFVPSNMLYCGFSGITPSLLWYTEPHKQLLHYSENIGFTTAVFHVPWLVWFYHNEDVYVFAAKEKPTKATKLYKAPFGNITKGVVCMGSGIRLINKDFKNFDEVTKSIETAFWGTNFTEQNDSNTINGNLISLHKQLNGTEDPFPLDVLIYARKTVKSLIDGKEEIEENNR